MTLDPEHSDELAYELVRTEFDAVERDGLRAAWQADDATVVVEALDATSRYEYDGEALVRAASEQEAARAREE